MTKQIVNAAVFGKNQTPTTVEKLKIMKRLFNFSISIILLVFWLSCSNDHKSEDINCKILTFYGSFYAQESVNLFFNDRSVLIKGSRDTINLQSIFKQFCIMSNENVRINFYTKFNNRIVLDTLVEISVDDTIPHKLTISKPHPPNWQDFYKDGFPVKNWGYLVDIDSSFRKIFFLHDSLNEYNSVCDIMDIDTIYVQ